MSDTPVVLCWFCKKNPADPKLRVRVHLSRYTKTEMHAFYNALRGEWRKTVPHQFLRDYPDSKIEGGIVYKGERKYVYVPKCSECKKKEGEFRTFGIICAIGTILSLAAGEISTGLMIAGLVATGVVLLAGFLKTRPTSASDAKEFPEVREAIENDGWEINILN